ncbi:mannose-6-phosphate isomerase, class I [Collibacillus ludicampi]|uniref:Mannose-6-phosphate isomerase n=1 Tax=Collibacillus ludicampi TaxID=2771369 RepID=A0AAV4LJJ1_9BACL|nr:type I phosphomannose isomerase catalytic subunit [Collibacillus ludicampi]GIM47944.1 mannose-6-phosphate isomerase, class I [Collibacillus ludicampi]
MFYPVKFAPIAHQRIWGGHKLKSLFGETRKEPIGEYWVLSGHPHATSMVTNGHFAGKSLVELTKEYPQAYLGNSPQNRFPLLIKFLEAEDDLSVQVHPHDQYAQEVEGDFGKTEAWYILDCRGGGLINYGHSFQNREEFLSAVKQKRIKDYLRYIEIKKDQFVFIPSQTLHALLAGTTLIEIQQTSDVTYRVYDWDRVDAQGKGRELHIEKAADVMRYGQDQIFQDCSTMQRILQKTRKIFHEQLATCPYFVIEKISIEDSCYSMKIGKKGNPDILIVAEGEGVLKTDGEYESLSLKQGDTVLIPSTMDTYEIHAISKIRLLRTYY